MNTSFTNSIYSNHFDCALSYHIMAVYQQQCAEKGHVSSNMHRGRNLGVTLMKPKRSFEVPLVTIFSYMHYIRSKNDHESLVHCVQCGQDS